MLFDISEHFISVRFPFNKEAVSILDEQTNGGVSGGVSGGATGGAGNADTHLSKYAIRV